jgi:glycosyltransferase involved in cell wall biosynthesis
MTSGERPLEVLYFCEGFTDIRFVVGLSEICDLTMATPAWEFRSSGLADRIAQSGARITVDEIHGRRPAFQIRSFLYLLKNIRHFDVVLSQEMVRGSLNATIAGRLAGVPVVTYLGVAPVEYFRCRRERGRISWMKAAAGEAFIRVAMFVSGRLATVALGMGPYLRDVAARTSPRAAVGGYYGVDVSLFRPVDELQRRALRRRHNLPENCFVIFFSSRISHEKDPETVLRATALARRRGLNAVLVNLGGGFKDFVACARDLGYTDIAEWLIGRPAVHPMGDLCEYFQTADAVIQSSLAEGAAFSTLEALACGTPVVATNIGGMAVQLAGVAQLTPRRDPEAMAEAIQWIASHPAEARAQALKGCEYVRASWRRERVFAELKRVLEEAARGAPQRSPQLNERSA